MKLNRLVVRVFAVRVGGGGFEPRPNHAVCMLPVKQLNHKVWSNFTFQNKVAQYLAIGLNGERLAAPVYGCHKLYTVYSQRKLRMLHEWDRSAGEKIYSVCDTNVYKKDHSNLTLYKSAI